MRVTLLRHSQTQDNLLGRYPRRDAPLCPQGRDLARQLPPRPDVSRVHTSTLVRTVETAEILYAHAAIHRHPGLRELDFGEWEGKSWQDLEQDPRYRQWVDRLCQPPCPGGESQEEMTRRCVRAFLEVLAEEAAQDAGEVHLVVHGGTIMAVLSQLAQPQRPYFDWHPAPCGGYLLEYAPGQPRPLAVLAPIRPKEGATSL